MDKGAKSYSDLLRNILRLKTYPVGLKICEKKEEVQTAEIVSQPYGFCQLVKIVSQTAKTIFLPVDKIGCFTAQMILGTRSPGEKDLEHHRGQFTDDKEIARKLLDSKPKFKQGEVKGFIFGKPEDIECDQVYLIVDSLQALVLLEAYCVAKGEELNFRNGVSSTLCSYGCVYVYRNRNPNLVIPCVGARKYGLFQDVELCFVFPAQDMNSIITVLKEFQNQNRLHLPIAQAYLSPGR